jgi:hypothetical protein
MQARTMTKAPPRQKSFVKEHSLTIAVITGMVLFAIAFWFAGLENWQAEQRAHGQGGHIWPDFVVYYVADMTDSLFGSLFGVLVIVQGTKYLRERGDHPSNQDKST